MKRLRETSIRRDYRGLTCEYEGDGIKTVAFVELPESVKTTVEHRNACKRHAIAEVRSMFGKDDLEVVIEMQEAS